ncbi:MAG TPA: amidase [Bryobacteraceae bacterium]|nr:amidase [Bryobacteraceae bacterium]
MLRQFVKWIGSGEKTPAQAMALCLERIATRDGEVLAWVEAAPRVPSCEGPLSGVPFGAKDIFETRGMATEYGSPLFEGRKGERDAALVSHLMAKGAVLMGKTRTTPFAYLDPAPTRNPRAPGRTPGGSSSGSAAAVAAGMVPFALGTQTQGSVIRPAAFCGVVGFKPTFAKLPMEGVLGFAPSLDAAGLFTETAADMQVLWERAGWGSRVPPPRRAAWFACYDAPDALHRLRAAGWGIDVIDTPPEFAALLAAVRLINDYEGARTHRALWERHGAAIGLKLAAMVESGLSIPEERYRAALDCVKIGKQKMAVLFRHYPVVMTPAAPGPAPEGLASTGDSRMNAPWTGLGVPAITVPLPVEGPPLGLQMTVGAGEDDLLLAAAVEVEHCFTR